jgi:ABC-type uncharacterized transport system substrate-binding protein
MEPYEEWGETARAAMDNIRIRKTLIYIQTEIKKALENTFTFCEWEGTVNVNVKLPPALEYININFTITKDDIMSAQKAYDETNRLNADKNQRELDFILARIKDRIANNHFYYNVRSDIGMITMQKLREAGYTFSGGYGPVTCVIHWSEPKPVKEN